MDVDPAKTQYKSVYQGKTFYFCSDSCKRKFDAAPKQYLPGSDDAHKRGAM
jgi:YHS domain-containing protein